MLFLFKLRRSHPWIGPARRRFRPRQSRDADSPCANAFRRFAHSGGTAGRGGPYLPAAQPVCWCRAVTRSSRRPGRFANDPSDRVARHFQPADAALEPPPSWLPRRWAAGPGLHRELGRPCSTGLWPGPATRVVLYEEMSALSFRLLPWSTPLGRASGSERRQSGRPGAAVSLVWPAPNTPVVRQARKSYPPLATGRRMRTGEAWTRRMRADIGGLCSVAPAENLVSENYGVQFGRFGSQFHNATD